jgi:hypothetical protein
MSYQDHYRTCSYCNKGLLSSKPTIWIKSASSTDKRRKLIELGHLVRGIPIKTKGASVDENNFNRPRPRPGPIEKAIILRELGKMIRGN